MAASPTSDNLYTPCMCRMMIISCQWDFNEQIKKMVRLLPSIPARIVEENSTRLGTSCTQVSKRRVKKKTATSLEPSSREIRQHGCADFHYIAVLFTLSLGSYKHIPTGAVMVSLLLKQPVPGTGCLLRLITFLLFFMPCGHDLCCYS